MASITAARRSHCTPFTTTYTIPTFDQRALRAIIYIEGRRHMRYPQGPARHLRVLLAAVASVATAVVLAPPAAASAAAAATVHVNVAAGGGPTNDYSASPSISGDGDVVIFTSIATNLAPGFPTGGSGNVLYARDLRTGFTSAINVSNSGRSTNLDSSDSDLDGIGLNVAFTSADLPSLSPGAAQLCSRNTRQGPVPEYCRNIFLRNRLLGLTTRISTALGGGQPNGVSDTPRLSGDGRFVAFRSEATNLVTGDTNGVADVFLRDLLTGITRRIAPPNPAAPANSYNPTISADGRWVAFANDGIASDPSISSIALHDRITATTSVLALPSASGGVTGGLPDLDISGNGQVVAFTAQDSALVPGDTNPGFDVFVFDRSAGTLIIADRTADGTQLEYADRIQLSRDGRSALFRGNGLLTPDTTTTGSTHVYVRNLVTGAIRLVNVDADGLEANGYSDIGSASISDNGARVSFSSDGTNLYGGDTNNTTDIFVRIT